MTNVCLPNIATTNGCLASTWNSSNWELQLRLPKPKGKSKFQGVQRHHNFYFKNNGSCSIFKHKHKSNLLTQAINMINLLFFCYVLVYQRRKGFQEIWLESSLKNQKHSFILSTERLNGSFKAFRKLFFWSSWYLQQTDLKLNIKIFSLYRKVNRFYPRSSVLDLISLQNGFIKYSLSANPSFKTNVPFK